MRKPEAPRPAYPHQQALRGTGCSLGWRQAGTGTSAQWMAAATMMLMPRHIAATTMARALFCFSTISRHRS